MISFWESDEYIFYDLIIVGGGLIGSNFSLLLLIINFLKKNIQI